MNDVPFRNTIPHLKKLPGQVYTIDEQCQREFGSSSRYCSRVSDLVSWLEIVVVVVVLHCMMVLPRQTQGPGIFGKYIGSLESYVDDSRLVFPNDEDQGNRPLRGSTKDHLQLLY